MPDVAFLSTVEFGRRVDVSATTAWRTCQRHPGFAVQTLGSAGPPRGESPAKENWREAELDLSVIVLVTMLPTIRNDASTLRFDDQTYRRIWMRAILLFTTYAALATSSALASHAVISPNIHHHPVVAYERHAERFSLDGAECVAKTFQVKSTDGELVTGKSVDCQE
jgi:hypothetical protein